MCLKKQVGKTIKFKIVMLQLNIRKLKIAIYFFSNYFLALFILLISTSFVPKVHPFGIKRVVIDAGHGGHDSGCLGASSKEKDVALAISLGLGKHIEQTFKDVKVVYTRDKDVFVDLHKRAKIANDNNADLFICIHCNSGQSKAMGAETYVMGLHKTKENLDVAKRENEAILLEDDYKKNYEGFDPSSDEAHIIFSMFQSAFLDQSVNVASKIQKHITTKASRKDRGVKQAGFLVLYKTSCPSVLIETGFLTNREEETFLKNPQNQKIMSSAIFEAFKEYKSEVEKKPAPISNAFDNAENTETSNQPEKIENESINTASSIIFKVQLATSPKKMNTASAEFSDLGDVSEVEHNGLLKYIVGNETTLSAATTLQDLARKKGFKDAFVIAYKNGERISVKEALKEIQ